MLTVRGLFSPRPLIRSLDAEYRSIDLHLELIQEISLGCSIWPSSKSGRDQEWLKRGMHCVMLLHMLLDGYSNSGLMFEYRRYPAETKSSAVAPRSKSSGALMCFNDRVKLPCEPF